MDVQFGADNKVSRIKLGKDAKAEFIPMQDADPYRARLRMFNWFVNKRPQSFEDIYSFNSDL